MPLLDFGLLNLIDGNAFAERSTVANVDKNSLAQQSIESGQISACSAKYRKWTKIRLLSKASKVDKNLLAQLSIEQTTGAADFIPSALTCMTQFAAIRTAS